MQEAHFDPEEIRKFEAMAEEWWDPKGKFRPLHRINPLRLDYIADHAPLAGASVLDVGCGGGLLAEGMAARGAHITGIDRSPKALAVARIHAGQSGADVRYEESDAQAWAADHAGAYDTRGNWYLTDDFMAGPFVNYTLVDKKNKRLIVAEGLVYAPNIKKRDYIFELESIIKTLKLKK
jgi:SAM-dependent methyltransferase